MENLARKQTHTMPGGISPESWEHPTILDPYQPINHKRRKITAGRFLLVAAVLAMCSVLMTGGEVEFCSGHHGVDDRDRDRPERRSGCKRNSHDSRN